MDPRRPRGGAAAAARRARCRPRPAGSAQGAAGDASAAPAAVPRGCCRGSPSSPRSPCWLTAGAGWALLNFYDGKISRIAGLDLGEDRPADLPRDAQEHPHRRLGQPRRARGRRGHPGHRRGLRHRPALRHGDPGPPLRRRRPGAAGELPARLLGDDPGAHRPDTGELVEAHEGKLNSALLRGRPVAAHRDDRGPQPACTSTTTCRSTSTASRPSSTSSTASRSACPRRPRRRTPASTCRPAAQVIQGDQALAFVRQRKGLPNGDIDRIRRQQQFIGAIVRKVLSAGTLLNPLQLNGVITVGDRVAEVDEGLSIDDLQRPRAAVARLRRRRRRLHDRPDRRRQRRPPAAVGRAARRGAGRRALRAASAATSRPALPDARRRAAAPAEPLIVAPSSVRVKVYNGAGVAGLGRRAAADLEEVGFLHRRRRRGPRQQRHRAPSSCTAPTAPTPRAPSPPPSPERRPGWTRPSTAPSRSSWAPRTPAPSR